MLLTTGRPEEEFDHTIDFDGNKIFTISDFESLWKKKDYEKLEFYCSEKRKLIEDNEFWKRVGELFAENNKIKFVRFYSHIYGDKHDVFEENVLKNVPDHVQIYFNDWKSDKETKGELKDWITKYNIVCLDSLNYSIIECITKNKALKVLELQDVTSFEQLDPLFRNNESYLHALCICFKESVE